MPGRHCFSTTLRKNSGGPISASLSVHSKDLCKTSIGGSIERIHKEKTFSQVDSWGWTILVCSTVVLTFPQVDTSTKRTARHGWHFTARTCWKWRSSSLNTTQC